MDIPVYLQLFDTVEGDVTMIGDASEPNRAHKVRGRQVTIDKTKPHISGYVCGMHRHYHDNL